MSGNSKIIIKPKVRFSQFSDNEKQSEKQNKKQGDVESYEEKPTVSKRKNGPKIRSIVSLKKPVKIVNPKTFIDTSDKNVRPNNYEKEISTHRDNTTFQNSQEASPFKKKSKSKVETSRILCNANDTNKTKEYKTLQPDKSVHVQSNFIKNGRKNLQKKGKENKDTALKQIASDKIEAKTSAINSQSLQSAAYKKLKHSASDVNMRKLNTVDSKDLRMTKSRSAPNIARKMPIQAGAKSVLNVMPCYKYTMTSKSKKFPVKKTVLFDVTSPKVKTSVEPGISHRRQDNAKTNSANIKPTVPLNVNVEKLARPQYNSIRCTVDKLEKLKQQKIVTDIHRLPLAQKNLINEKISNALDFPLGETIFRDLIDVNIDDAQLPSAITRSKDPEPRKKDITPKLSDFFIPEYTKEICTAVRVKPRASKIDENWNTCKISDKIFDWMHSLDDA